MTQSDLQQRDLGQRYAVGAVVADMLARYVLAVPLACVRVTINVHPDALGGLTSENAREIVAAIAAQTGSAVRPQSGGRTAYTETEQEVNGATIRFVVFAPTAPDVPASEPWDDARELGD